MLLRLLKRLQRRLLGAVKEAQGKRVRQFCAQFQLAHNS